MQIAGEPSEDKKILVPLSRGDADLVSRALKAYGEEPGRGWATERALRLSATYRAAVAPASDAPNPTRSADPAPARPTASNGDAAFEQSLRTRPPGRRHRPGGASPR